MLIDQYNRVHDYLRISLTDNCNLRCFYCMPEEDYAFMPNQRLMQKDEIVQLATLFVQNGVKKNLAEVHAAMWNDGPCLHLACIPGDLLWCQVGS